MAVKDKTCIRIGLSLAVAAIDDFNDRPADGRTLKVWIEGERPAIRNQEGYYVFVDLKKTEVVLHLESSIYNRQTLSINLKEHCLGQRGPLVVRMTPSHSYPVPGNITCIEGKAEPASVLWIYSREMENPYKLLSVCEEGSEVIRIFHPGGVNIEGKPLFMAESGEGAKEFIQIDRKSREGVEGAYRLKTPVRHSYKKVGTDIYPVYTSKADERGEFFLPIPVINAKKSIFTVLVPGRQESGREIELQAGIVNRI